METNQDQGAAPRLQPHELESMRRSLAMADHLPADQTARLIETCAALLAERARIERVLAELGPAWGGALRALNELHKIVRR